MSAVQWLNFHPLPGLRSRHLQTILPSLRRLKHSLEFTPWLVDIGQGDFLSCKVSKPGNWKPCNRTVVLLHGLGGCASGKYMVRMASKVTERGLKAVRVNFRGCGSGKGLSKLPYHAGCSQDILRVLEACKTEDPESRVTLIGFSIGANIALKLLGELGEAAKEWVDSCFAICSPLDLKQTASIIGKKRYSLYQRYYLKRISSQAAEWIKQKISSIYEFDQLVTVPFGGFADVDDYYQRCSSNVFLPKICCPTHLLFAADDPFVDPAPLHKMVLPDCVKVWLTKHGGHMGFLGRTPELHNSYWLDHLLLNWLEGDFKSDASFHSD